MKNLLVFSAEVKRSLHPCCLKDYLMLTLTSDCSTHTYLLHSCWEYSHSAASVLSICHDEELFSFHVLQMLPSVRYEYLCSHVSGLSVFSERWIVAVLYSYIFVTVQY